MELAQQTVMHDLAALKQEGMQQIQHVRKKHDDPRDRKALHDIADMYFWSGLFAEQFIMNSV